MTSITWRGQEVTNPILRVCCTVIVAFGVGAMLIVIPFSLPIHLALLLFGRRGFASYGENGGIDYVVDWRGFERVS